MPYNVTIQGADYQDVPKIIVPKTGGGLAEFYGDLKPWVLRQDAEKVYTWSYDMKAVEDLELTIPAYSTSAQTLRASVAMDNPYTVDYTNYNYYLLERMLTIPEYSITTKGKGRVDHFIASCAYELTEIPENEIHGIFEPTRLVTSASRGLIVVGAMYRSVYYSSATALAAYSTSAYTTSQIVAAPTLSGGKITVNTPTWSMRGSTTYFVNTYFNAITEIRNQFVAELYRVPKGSMNIDGWAIGQQMMHVVECANNNNHKLT